MAIRESSYGYWRSYRGFFWVAGGAAIGIGNIARLPYLASEYGGLYFLVAYVLALGLVAWPLLVAEWLIGRWTREDLLSGLGHLAQAASLPRAWSIIGYLALAASVAVLSYYSVIAGWSLAYAFRAAGGVLSHLAPDQVQAVFMGLAKDPERSLAWHTIFMVTVCIVVAGGVRDGIERAASYLVPAATLLMLVLFIYAYTVGDSQAAVQHVFRPDWQRFGWRGAIEAIHQAFFTMALGLGVMVGYGAYLPANAPLLRLAAAVVAFDTLFSVVAGSALYALILGAGLDPAPGLTLLFQVFPLTLSQGVVSDALACGTYIALFVITLAAAVALMEPPVRYLVERFRVTRVSAAMASGILIWFLGLGTILSFNIAQGISVYGGNFFDWLQWLTGRVMLPAGALLLTVFLRILPPQLMEDLWGPGSRRGLVIWSALMRFPVRLALIVLLLYCLGLLEALIQLWS